MPCGTSRTQCPMCNWRRQETGVRSQESGGLDGCTSISNAESPIGTSAVWDVPYRSGEVTSDCRPGSYPGATPVPGDVLEGGCPQPPMMRRRRVHACVDGRGHASACTSARGLRGVFPLFPRIGEREERGFPKPLRVPPDLPIELVVPCQDFRNFLFRSFLQMSGFS
jgi:hypothetical protein